MLLKLLVVFAGCKGLFCNAIIPATPESYSHEPENDKPEIVNLHLVYEVKIGENVEIDCLATGYHVLYHWSKDLQDIVNTNRFTVFVENGTMRVISVEETDRGVYTCAASNSFGSSDQNFTINVLLEPSIDQFEDITIAENTEGILTCKAKGRPAPVVTFSWYGWELTSSEYSSLRDVIPTQVVNEELGETIATLNFTRALRSYYGEYACLAKNKIDSVKQIAYVTIEYPPNFNYMEKPAPAYSYDRRPVNLSCKPKALPEATIVWFWNDKLISELDDMFFEVINSGSESTLVVEPVDDSYYSTYKCVASNKYGEAERIMELREAHPPESMAAVHARSWSTDMINFEIVASLTGTPAEFYKYQYKEEAEYGWIDSMNFTRVVMPVTTIYVQGLKPNTKYNFRFYAVNELGTSPFLELSHQTMCAYRYAEPKILNKVTEDRADGEVEFIESPYPYEFELIWEPIIEPCEEIIYYSIEYCFASHFGWNRPLGIYAGTCAYVNGITSNNYVIGNLTADTYYSIRLTSLITTSYHFMRTARDPITGGDPRLKIYPTNSVQNIEAGTFFNFTCKSRVESVTNLGWHDSFNNPINSKSVDGAMYTEAVNDAELVLVIPFVKHAMFGTYYCASSGGSEVIDTFVKIETYTFIGGSQDFEYNIGISGRYGYISCSFYNDDNTPMEWMFENNPIEPSDRYEFIIEEYMGSTPRYVLIIRNHTESDEGFYTCRQSTNERIIYHEVLLAPSILNIETEYLAVEGIDFAIDCLSVGKPAPNVKWIDQNGTDVTLNSRFSVNRSGQMKIGRIEVGDEGSYTCEAQSIAGMSGKTVQIKVKSK